MSGWVRVNDGRGAGAKRRGSDGWGRGAVLPRATAWLLLWLLLVGAVGCGRTDVQTVYGRRQHLDGSSLNGTRVLSEMFEDAGHRVISRERISPALNQHEILVWFPDDFAVPTPREREALELWLQLGGRTLVYVGRDFDAQVGYWQDAARVAPPEQQDELARREAFARAQHDTFRQDIPDGEYARWFRVTRDLPRTRLTTLSGPWAQGIDGRAAEIVIEAELAPPLPKHVKAPAGGNFSYARDARLPRSRPLLTSGGRVMVHEVTDGGWNNSKVLVVANGSFLLNYQLLNHEHRKLAARLVAESGTGGESVVFLESDAGGLMVREDDNEQQFPTGFEIFRVWPLGFILTHLLLLMVVGCFFMYPIFGRPRALVEDELSDFGKHITAFGKLLARTQNRVFARQRLDEYHQRFKRDSGASHLEKPSAKPPESSKP